MTSAELIRKQDEDYYESLRVDQQKKADAAAAKAAQAAADAAVAAEKAAKAAADASDAAASASTSSSAAVQASNEAVQAAAEASKTTEEIRKQRAALFASAAEKRMASSMASSMDVSSTQGDTKRAKGGKRRTRKR